MAIGEFFLGSPAQTGQLSRYSSDNQQQFNDLIGQLLQGFQSNKFDFSPIEQEARAGFEQKTLPSIAERFTSLGAGGGRSSAFGQQLGAAGSDLERSLASMRQQYGLQQQGLQQNLLGMGAQEPTYQPRQSGFLERLLMGLIGAGGQLGGAALQAKIGAGK